ncbi:MAG: N-formylglutamate amidohydrolase [Actinomycetota bacterium]
MATAVHAGHDLRSDAAAAMALPEADRLREEDPFTERFAGVVPNRFLAHRSRFELDLNRPRGRAVYLKPEHAWGLDVWREPPSNELLEESLRLYDGFYTEFAEVLSDMESRHGLFMVLDMHSYNHRRGGPQAPPDAAEANPDVNVGTSDLELGRWGDLLDHFMDDLAAQGEGLDVRANVRFTGGHLIQWVQKTCPRSSGSLAIEFKKTFMDEHTGDLDETRLDRLVNAFRAVLPGLQSELKGVAR